MNNLLINKKCSEKITDNIKQTQGFKKINNYLFALIKSNNFNNLVDNCRKKYNIPKQGFDNNGKYLSPPKEWEADTGKNSKYDNLINEIEKFCREKKLLYFNLYTYIYDFIVYNKSIEQIDDDLCMVRDSMNDSKMPKKFNFINDEENYIYPISIKISPYASQRDIIDFIKKNDKKIKTYQKLYIENNVKIGKYKSKKFEIQERNEIIYNNCNKHLKEIRHILADKNIFLDDGHIAKIISLEKQKRKEV